jgi:hypothetical protein
VPRVLHLVAVAVDDEVLETDIETDGTVVDSVLVRSFTVVDQQEGGPLVGRRVFDGNALDITLDGMMQSDRNVAYLRSVQEAELVAIRFEPKAGLVVGDGSKNVARA